MLKNEKWSLAKWLGYYANIAIIIGVMPWVWSFAVKTFAPWTSSADKIDSVSAQMIQVLTNQAAQSRLLDEEFARERQMQSDLSLHTEQLDDVIADVNAIKTSLRMGPKRISISQPGEPDTITNQFHPNQK